ncbi:MAG: usp [Deltaproteobacteria bacterium]|jgi:nucleotide-binding universal stress UspA family protein|nr:usp [Deltaproteobacteria bacterium]
MLSLRKKILVAIDGSPMSDKAAEEAVRLAAGNTAQFKSKVYAMLVLPNAPRSTFTDFVPPKPVTETEAWGELRDKIFFVIEKNAAESAIPLEIKVAYGDPADELLGFAEKEEIDVIVIGSTGKGFLKRKVLGSVSDRIVRNAKCSVYVIRG